MVMERNVSLHMLVQAFLLLGYVSNFAVLAGFHNAFPDPPSRFTPPPPGTKFDAVVIGAGGGGLSAAAKLSLHGQKVLVLERSPRIGGAWVTFNLTGDDGWSYRVDGSLHVLNAPAPANEIVETDYFKLLQETGAYEKLQWTPRRSIHRLVLDKEGKGREWTIFTDEDKLIEEMTSKGFPGQEAPIRALLNLTNNIVHQVIFPFSFFKVLTLNPKP